MTHSGRLGFKGASSTIKLINWPLIPRSWLLEAYNLFTAPSMHNLPTARLGRKSQLDCSRGGNTVVINQFLSPLVISAREYLMMITISFPHQRPQYQSVPSYFVSNLQTKTTCVVNNNIYQLGLGINIKENVKNHHGVTFYRVTSALYTVQGTV